MTSPKKRRRPEGGVLNHLLAGGIEVNNTRRWVDMSTILQAIVEAAFRDVEVIEAVEDAFVDCPRCPRCNSQLVREVP